MLQLNEEPVDGRSWNRPMLSGATRIEPIPINSPPDNNDSTLRTLFDIAPEIIVLAVSFRDELGIMRITPDSARTRRCVVVAVAGGIGDFSAHKLVRPEATESSDPASRSRA